MICRGKGEARKTDGRGTAERFAEKIRGDRLSDRGDDDDAHRLLQRRTGYGRIRAGNFVEEPATDFQQDRGGDDHQQNHGAEATEIRHGISGGLALSQHTDRRELDRKCHSLPFAPGVVKRGIVPCDQN